jgi:Beta-eliminating lyase
LPHNLHRRPHCMPPLPLPLPLPPPTTRAAAAASGTMANLIATGAHCARGDEAIVGATSHMFLYEGGGAAAFLGVSLATAPVQRDGSLALRDVRAAVRADDVHCPRTRLLCLENTQNRAGGAPLPRAYLAAAAQFARDHGLKLHIDGEAAARRRGGGGRRRARSLPGGGLLACSTQRSHVLGSHAAGGAAAAAGSLAQRTPT